MLGSMNAGAKPTKRISEAIAILQAPKSRKRRSDLQAICKTWAVTQYNLNAAQKKRNLSELESELVVAMVRDTNRLKKTPCSSRNCFWRGSNAAHVSVWWRAARSRDPRSAGFATACRCCAWQRQMAYSIDEPLVAKRNSSCQVDSAEQPGPNGNQSNQSFACDMSTTRTTSCETKSNGR